MNNMIRRLSDGQDASASGARPLVSVLIPAYNAEATLDRALKSAFEQDYRPLEVIVVDDGSLDMTSEVASSHHGEVRLVRLPKNSGVCVASNRAIAEAHGVYVAFLDADDEWLPGKISKQVAIMEANPKASFVTCGCVFVDQAGAVFREFGERPPGLGKGEIWRALLATTWVAKPCVMARRSVLSSVGSFDPALAVAEDQDMWIRLAMAGEVEFISETLVRCHDTPNSLTKVYANRIADYVLPVLFRYLERRKADLTLVETRRILGERYSSIGRNLYVNGSLLRGANYILRATAKGFRRRENLWYLVTAAPPVQKMKRALRLPAVTAAPPTSEFPSGSVFAPAAKDAATLPLSTPVLTVVVDAEAEFDWNKPFTRDLTNVLNLRRQEAAQRLFERFNVKPSYMVAYAVATQADGYLPLRDFHRSGACEIGAHLQPWENPPFDEELTSRNSFVGNLPGWLHKEKLSQLTDAITANFGTAPIAHKAGRYGLGPASASILASLGYAIDLSVLPSTDLRAGQGPNFLNCPTHPYWFGPARDLLEIPMTVAFLGLFAQNGAAILKRLNSPTARAFHAPGLFARLGLLDRITLTPEGITLSEMKRLVRNLLAKGQRTFTLSYHSSSLLPGGSPYVRSEADVAAFLGKIEHFLEFFFGEIGGSSMTPGELHRLALASRQAQGKLAA